PSAYAMTAYALTARIFYPRHHRNARKGEAAALLLVLLVFYVNLSKNASKRCCFFKRSECKSTTFFVFLQIFLQLFSAKTNLFLIY
ncbi:MAG: hypothetical protein J5637_04090, partial [Prevotella sp.]|nr:hypothetical protein [Prevotella sp.]